VPWNSDQLPWTNFKYPNPNRPSGIFESLNWMPGSPILIRGGAAGNLSGPPIMLGGGARSLSSGPPVMLGGGIGKSSGGPSFPVMLGTDGTPNLYSAPSVLRGSR
jgi:hypothetical protein